MFELLVHHPRTIATLLAAITVAAPCHADVLSDLNELAFRTAVAAREDPGGQTRTLTIVHLAMFDAANAVERRFAAYRPQTAPPAGATAAGAVVGAGCGALQALYPTLQATIERDCAPLVATVSAGDPGLAAGERIGVALVAARKDDGSAAPNTWRPVTAPGVYIPTALPGGWNARTMRPFALREPAQFRPGPPPALASAEWARDYNEIKAIGSRASAQRTPEQSTVAAYWAPSGPIVFNPLVRQAADTAGSGTTDRARVYALAYVAASDASIAVFDAKYTYNFWRPLTAIRNGDLDGNDATERDAGWFSMLDSPMHPEYPCAHCINAGAIAEVLASVLGSGELAKPLTMATPGAPAATATVRTFRRVGDVVDEIGNARVWSGIHFRNSTTVGATMGRSIGQYVLATQLKPL